MTKEIPLTRGLVAVVDDADYDRVKDISWSASSVKYGDRCYARRWVPGGGGAVQGMHAFLTGYALTDHDSQNETETRNPYRAQIAETKETGPELTFSGANASEVKHHPQIATQEPADPECSCAACDPGLFPGEAFNMLSRMNVCPDCGNKRCPKAANHAKWQCSGSNAVGQVGVRVQDAQNRAQGSVGGVPAGDGGSEGADGALSAADAALIEGANQAMIRLGLRPLTLDEIAERFGSQP